MIKNIILRNENVTLLAESKVLIRGGNVTVESLRGGAVLPKEDLEKYKSVILSKPDLSKLHANKFSSNSFGVLSVWLKPGSVSARPGEDERLDTWLSESIISQRGRYREVIVGDLLNAGYTVLPTTIIEAESDDPVRFKYDAPEEHYDIVLKSFSDKDLEDLLSLFSEDIINPFKVKTSRRLR